MNKISQRPDLSILKKDLPPIIPRNKVGIYLGDIYSTGYLENLDSRGEGPRRIRIGRRAGYLREDLIAWLEERASIEESNHEVSNKKSRAPP